MTRYPSHAELAGGPFNREVAAAAGGDLRTLDHAVELASAALGQYGFHGAPVFQPTQSGEPNAAITSGVQPTALADPNRVAAARAAVAAVHRAGQ